MTRLLPTRLLATLCVLAFGLGQVVSSVGVRCQRASGEVRLELACAKTSQGACFGEGADACCDEGDEAPGEPCRDEPIGSQAFVVKQVRSTAVAVEFDAFAVIAWWDASTWGAWQTGGDRASALVRPAHQERPPDSLARLKTVRLLV